MKRAIVCWLGECTRARVSTDAVIVNGVIGIQCPRRGFVAASSIKNLIEVLYP